jgi:hypothetical protein
LAQPQAKQRSRGASSAPAGADDNLDAELAALGDSDDDDDLGELDDDEDMDEETKVCDTVTRMRERKGPHWGESFSPSSECSSCRF